MVVGRWHQSDPQVVGAVEYRGKLVFLRTERQARDNGDDLEGISFATRWYIGNNEFVDGKSGIGVFVRGMEGIFSNYN